MYYNGYGSYDYTKKILLRKLLEEVKKKLNTASLENLTTTKISTGLSVL